MANIVNFCQKVCVAIAFGGLGSAIAKRDLGIAVLRFGGSALAVAYRRYRFLGVWRCDHRNSLL
ncbi:MAG: hypothetical protein F6K62_05510 [Sphaerospermopsis sp. SIO1G2]|nr:hypothetical protein [Sphaerospermopsis sp. SIO1G1]NET70456.1 hypothetical protein [Sphaerospermopsis sp. SIO1G2]